MATTEPTASTPPAVVTTEQEDKALAAARPVNVAQFDPDDPTSLYMNPSIFEQLQRVAKLMSASELVPPHLRSKQADCFLVAAQAFRWGMDPFSVAQHTFVLSGRLGYEGKLIAALINSSGKTVDSLRPIYSGEKGARRVQITATLKGETEPRTVEGSVAEWQTQNVKWRELPDQMLFYRGAREWARRHAPEIVLGLAGDDELEPLPPTPKEERPTIATLKAKLRAATDAPAREPGADDGEELVLTPETDARRAEGPKE